jgi:hypothetical protein
LRLVTARRGLSSGLLKRLASGQGEHRDAVRDDDPDRSTVRDDDALLTQAPETRHAAPASRRGPREVDLETAASDVRDRSARVAGDRGDDAEHGLARRDGNESEVVIERPLAADDERDARRPPPRGPYEGRWEAV